MFRTGTNISYILQSLLTFRLGRYFHTFSQCLCMYSLYSGTAPQEIFQPPSTLVLGSQDVHWRFRRSLKSHLGYRFEHYIIFSQSIYFTSNISILFYHPQQHIPARIQECFSKLKVRIYLQLSILIFFSSQQKNGDISDCHYCAKRYFLKW